MIVYGHLTDAMAATPALRSLRLALPHARIEVLALRAANPVLARSPHVDQVIEWDDFRRKTGSLGRMEKAAVISGLGMRLRRRGYDATLVLHCSFRPMRMLARMIQSPYRAGITDGSDGYTHPAPLPIGGVESFREENSRVLAAFGIAEDGGPVELHTTDSERRDAERILQANPGPLIGIHPGADWSCQEWFPDRFADVASALARATGGRIVLTGSSSQTALQAEITDRLGAEPSVQAAGRTSFGTFVEVVRRLDLLVCVSSAASAVADAVGTRSVVLMGPEDARYTGMTNSSQRRVLQPGGARAVGSWCELARYPLLSGCESPVCRGVDGLDRLSADEVTAAALDLLRTAGPRL